MNQEGTEAKPKNGELIKNTRVDEYPVFTPANEECDQTDQLPGPAVYNDKQAVLGKNKRGKKSKASKSGACAMMWNEEIDLDIATKMMFKMSDDVVDKSKKESRRVLYTCQMIFSCIYR